MPSSKPAKSRLVVELTRTTFDVPVRDLSRHQRRDRKRRRIFLFDDQLRIREWIAGQIHKLPDLEICGESQMDTRALEMFARSRPDLAIVDISLNNLSGVKFAETLKRQAPEVPVLVLSLHDKPWLNTELINPGAIKQDEFQTKLNEAIYWILDDRPFAT